MRDLSSEIIRYLRGKRPSAPLSKRLGFQSNVIYKWETGGTEPDWLQFVKYCEIVDPEFLAKFKIQFRIRGELTDVAGVFNDINLGYSLSQISKRLKVSKSTTSRWAAGKLVPSFRVITQIIELSGPRLHAFLCGFEKFRAMPMLARHLQVQSLFFSHPETLLLWNLVDLEVYKNNASFDDAWLCDQAGVPHDIGRHILKSMAELEILEMQDGKWAHGKEPVFIRGNESEERRMRKFWLERTIRNVDRKDDPDVLRMNYSIVTCDDASYEKLLFTFAENNLRIVNVLREAQSKPQTKMLALLSVLYTL